MQKVTLAATLRATSLLTLTVDFDFWLQSVKAVSEQQPERSVPAHFESHKVVANIFVLPPFLTELLTSPLLADVHLQKTAAAMPRAIYTVNARNDAGHLFEHNYQVDAPASLGTQSTESITFLQNLCGSHCKQILEAAPFQCVICAKKAANLVMQPFVFKQTADSVIYDQPTPVCGSASCDLEARQNLQAMVRKWTESSGEML